MAESLRKVGRYREAVAQVSPLQKAYAAAGSGDPVGQDIYDHALIVELYCLQRMWLKEQNSPQAPPLSHPDRARVRAYCLGEGEHVIKQNSAHYARWLCWRVFCLELRDRALQSSFSARLTERLREALQTEAESRRGPLARDIANARAALDARCL